MEAVVSSRGLSNLLHDALRLHVLLSPCIDGHMGALEQKQHLKYKLCKLRREQAKLPVHIAKASSAHKGQLSPAVNATEFLLQFNRCSGTFHLFNETDSFLRS